MNLVSITSADGSTVAQYAPAAGMVGSSLRHRGVELLDPRQGLEEYAEHGSTMGIPLLYPWANRLAGFQYHAAGQTVTLPTDGATAPGARIPLDPSGLPIHGLIPGLMRWSLEPGEQPSRLSAHLAWNTAELLELFPFEHEVELEVEAGAGTLTVRTTVRASGARPVPVSFGFHPYLRLPASRREGCRLELPPARRLGLDSRMIPTGERGPWQQRSLELAATSWDDAFELIAQPARFAAVAANRTVAVELLEGFPYAQIYAPPGKDFICFEPMTAPANALCSGESLSLLAAGEEYRAVFRITASAASPPSGLIGRARSGSYGCYGGLSDVPKLPPARRGRSEYSYEDDAREGGGATSGEARVGPGAG